MKTRCYEALSCHIRSVLVNRRKKKWNVRRRLVLKAQRKFIVVKYFLSAQKKSLQACPPDWRVDGVHLFVTRRSTLCPDVSLPLWCLLCTYLNFCRLSSQKPMLKTCSIVVYLNSFQLKSVSFRDTKKTVVMLIKLVICQAQEVWSVHTTNSYVPHHSKQL